MQSNELADIEVRLCKLELADMQARLCKLESVGGGRCGRADRQEPKRCPQHLRGNASHVDKWAARRRHATTATRMRNSANSSLSVGADVGALIAKSPQHLLGNASRVDK